MSALAVDPDVGDVTGRAGGAPVETSVGDDAGADRGADLHHDRLPVLGGPYGVLADRHAVGVVVHGGRDTEAFLQPGGDRETVPARHPRRQDDRARRDVHRPRQREPDPAQPAAAALLGQRLQCLGEPGQSRLGAVGDHEGDGRDIGQTAAGQHHTDPGVPAAEVGGDGELVVASQSQHFARAPACGGLGALLGDQPALHQMGHGERDGGGCGPQQSGKFGA